MKQCLLTLVCAMLGALTTRAEPVIDINGGSISRVYSYQPFDGGFIRSPVTETDDLTLNGSFGDLDFSIRLLNMTDSLVPYGPTFTDHITASAILCTPLLCGPDAVLGNVDLVVQAYLGMGFTPYPGPSRYTGGFSASGSFSGPGINLPLGGIGATTLWLVPLWEPDICPSCFSYGRGAVRYDFAPIPEPAVMFTTGAGLLALMLWSRRRISVRRHCQFVVDDH